MDNVESQKILFSVRKQLRDAFEENVTFALQNGLNDPLLDGLVIEAAIGELYKSLKDEPTLKGICSLYGIDYDAILEEECQFAHDKYLVR